MKNIQTLGYAMTLGHEAEVKLKRCKGLHNDDPSVMHASAVPHSEDLAVHAQSGPSRNAQDSNQMKDMNASRVN